MSDGQALLAAILAHPDEDTPRLVYADWLEENGQDERAEFIRVQVELAGLSEPCPQCEEEQEITDVLFNDERDRRSHSGPVKTLCHLHHRERELLRGNAIEGMPGENWVKWFSSRLPSFGSFLFDGEVVRGYDRPVRGFVESLKCHAEEWVAHADAILAAHPVRKVMLTTRPVVTIDRNDWFTVKRYPRKAHLSQMVGLFGKMSSQTLFADDDKLVMMVLWPGVEFELPLRPSPG